MFDHEKMLRQQGETRRDGCCRQYTSVKAKCRVRMGLYHFKIQGKKGKKQTGAGGRPPYRVGSWEGGRTLGEKKRKKLQGGRRIGTHSRANGHVHSDRQFASNDIRSPGILNQKGPEGGET